MIIVGILDISRFDIDKMEKECLEVISNVPKFDAENKRVRTEHTAAYISLSYLLKKFLGIDMPKVKYNKKSKPYFTNNDVKCEFNISHSENFVVLALSFIGENEQGKFDTPPSVGVDIEPVMTPKRKEAIEARYLSKLDFSPLEVNSEILPTYIHLSINECGKVSEVPGKYTVCSVNKKSIITNENYNVDSATARFTVLEAALKAEGGGFSSLSRFFDILSHTRTTTIKLTGEKPEYYISVAEMK